MIAGGGPVGIELAKCLESDYQIKVIDNSIEQIKNTGYKLTDTLLIEGNINNKELLISENIEDIDIFCSITNDDENNILASLQAKHLGAKYTIALFNNENYIDLIDNSVIDTSLSPHSITIGTILSKIRHSNMVKIHCLETEEAEAIELIIEGTNKNSAVIGRLISEIELPPDCILAGVVRNNIIYGVQSKLHLANHDHVIILVLKQKYIHQLEDLFAVNLTFMS
jgi:trk system potassium uptake protein TrkA